MEKQVREELRENVRKDLTFHLVGSIEEALQITIGPRARQPARARPDHIRV